MEHIIEFGVSIDDDAIKKHIIEKASEVVVEEAKKELGIHNRGYWGNDQSVVRKLVSEEVDKQFTSLKDAIVEETAKKLADKLVRTKAVKERTQKVLDSVLDEKEEK